MVKGVNKTVIEVNNTGSRLFEKIVFYVTPEYCNLSAKQLRKAASSFSFNFDSPHPKTSLRKRYKLRKRRVLCVSGVLIAAVTATVMLLSR